ncbi:alpha-glucan family phosphorylase [Ciceribacter ferrooxidans]|uniref:alpha-glucan family phosphorylase n=1 Tax=Ciceribacter ferrooxidans TaxID=2509717 RepID=UPI00196B2A7D|nr:alpha-glucan family phosphorylase [Ciceribacter ferrooxidans]
MQNQTDFKEAFDALRELALDVRWSWSHATDTIWQALDAEMWALTRNPWAIMRSVARDRIRTLLSDPEFSTNLNAQLAESRRLRLAPGWFQETHPNSGLRTVAYFSAEFMLDEALPLYSGGLGNVAGDQLKAASDLGVPVVGVGLLYARGYFRQSITPDGRQEALYPVNEPDQLPLRPLREPSGEWLRLELELPGYRLWVRTWEVQVGRTKLFLLDLNDPANPPAYRCITSELYGDGPETRLKQEMVLGIGGWRLLRAIGLNPEICHLNEGHVAFATLERARFFMQDHGVPFAEALLATRAGNLFTTHTAVTEGVDRFPPDMMARFFRRYAEKELGISVEEFLALGRSDPRNASEPFNMAYLAVRASGAVTGVSAPHERVSKLVFRPLFPRWPLAEVPIGHVTNGVHVPTWDSAAADTFWTEVAGKDRWRGDLAGHEAAIRDAPPARIWQMRTEGRRQLVEEVRGRCARQLAEDGAPEAEIDAVHAIFDSDALTLGFARRFATYKRPDLLLFDPERLVHLLTDRQRPVQLIVAGKAHPRDIASQALIKLWTDFTKREDVRSRVVFLRDYNMQLAQQLVQGVDVWINTPRRPWEASGTSGMKVLVNGGLNLSEIDGWWAEAFAPDVGWAIGDGGEHDDIIDLDRREAVELYAHLERDVVPEFYERDASGVPLRWVDRIRESMARLTPRFSANRAVREYTEDFYLPGVRAHAARTAKGGEAAHALCQWKAQVSRCWPHVHFGEIRTTTADGEHVFSVEVYLGDVPVESVRVELYADAVGRWPVFKGGMERLLPAIPSDGWNLYSAHVPAERPVSDFTARIVPFHPDLSVPLEAGEILWQR